MRCKLHLTWKLHHLVALSVTARPLASAEKDGLSGAARLVATHLAIAVTTLATVTVSRCR